MSNFYSNLFEIPAENFSIFENDRKKELSTLEKIGLESVLADFVQEYEEETEGEFFSKNIKDFIRYNESGVDFLDGVTDTYIFEHYAIGDVWTTNNGCIVMSCVDLDEFEDEDEDERERFNSSDLYDRPNSFDIWCQFKPVLFRLN